MSSLPDFCPADDAVFVPSPDDEAWAARMFADPTPAVADNGEPRTLRETVDDEARSYRAWRTPAGDLLADTLERLSQLLAWTNATNPRDHADRMSSWDDEIRARQYDQGYVDGIEAARREMGQSRPHH